MHTVELCSLATQDPRRADPHLSGVTGDSSARVLLIYSTVTVVVSTITDLLLGEGEGLAAQLPLVTTKQARSTDARLRGFTSFTPLRVLFIYETVAVVICSIAALLLRLKIGDTANGAVIAVACPQRTESRLPCLAGEASPGILLIDLAIAIIIDAVASLLLLTLLLKIQNTDAVNPPLNTGSDSLSTEPQLFGDALHAKPQKLLVHQTITVIVQTVTALIKAVLRPIADHATQGANPKPYAAVSLTGRTRIFWRP